MDIKKLHCYLFDHSKEHIVLARSVSIIPFFIGGLMMNYIIHITCQEHNEKIIVKFYSLRENRNCDIYWLFRCAANG